MIGFSTANGTETFFGPSLEYLEAKNENLKSVTVRMIFLQK
jgi:hypothetical protein